jgi:hypothetical protein
MKEELFLLRERVNPMALMNEIGEWNPEYNENYLHSSLGYKTQNQVGIEYLNS